ncbi:unnamed protein product, partial [Meganyctiphanes norvegica]
MSQTSTVGDNISNGHVEQTVTDDGTHHYTIISQDQIQESNVITLNSQDKIYDENTSYNQILHQEGNLDSAHIETETKPIVKRERPVRNRRAPVMPGMIMLDDDIRSISRTANKTTVKVKKENIPVEEYITEEM